MLGYQARTVDMLFAGTALLVIENGKVVGYFSATGDPPKFYKDFETHGMRVPLELFWTEEQKRARAPK